MSEGGAGDSAERDGAADPAGLDGREEVTEYRQPPVDYGAQGSESAHLETAMNAEDADMDEHARSAYGNELADLGADQYVHQKHPGAAPWHHPRKHYCRIRQWCRHAASLIKRLGLNRPVQGRALRYLSLPGDELLDIRTLVGVCQRSNVGLRFLGFNTAHSGERKLESDISFSEVIGIEGIQKEASLVVAERLERISVRSSKAHRTLQEHAPFDVVNLDLCDSIFGNRPGDTESPFQALRQIVDIQAARNHGPWLLFVTTRIGRDVANMHTVKGLMSLVASNAEDDTFCRAFEERYNLDCSTAANSEEGIESATDEVFKKLVSIGFAKWLMQVARPKGANPAIVEVLDCFTYRVHGSEPDMYSLSFHIAPSVSATTDATGITADIESEHVPSEFSMAAKALEALSQATDVDELLGRDISLFDRTARQATDVLCSARHSRSLCESEFGRIRTRYDQIWGGGSES